MFFCSICYKAEELRIKSIPAPHELNGNSDSIAQDQNEHDDLKVIFDKFNFKLAVIRFISNYNYNLDL